MRKKVSFDGITPSKKATTSVKKLCRRTFQSTPGCDSKSSASIKKTPAKSVQCVNPQSENKSSGTVNIVKRGRPKLNVDKEDAKEEGHVSSSVLMNGKRERGRPKGNLNRKETKDEGHVSSSMFQSSHTLVGSDEQARNKGGGTNKDVESDVEEMSTFNESLVSHRVTESLLVRGGREFKKRKRSSKEINQEQSDDDDDDEIEIPVGSSMKRILLESADYADLEDIPRVGKIILFVLIVK